MQRSKVKRNCSSAILWRNLALAHLLVLQYVSASKCLFFFFSPVNSDCSRFAALHWNMGEITIPRRLFLWCMSLIYMCAFVSLYVQIPGNNVHVYVVRAQSHTESCVGKNVSLLTTLASIFNLCVRSPSYATQLSGSFSSSRLTVIVKGSSN